MLNHLAIVMDGNRRWARKQGLLPYKGHEQGVQSIKKVMQFCVEQNIKHLSLYGFSLENFNRSPQELEVFFALIAHYAHEGIEVFKQHNVQVRFVGDRALFPVQVKKELEIIEQETAQNNTLFVHVLFCYGGRQEIFAGIKNLIGKIKTGELSEQNISATDFEACLWMAGIPEPDLIIRTGGAQRLSNFLLYHAAYSELYFLDCLWPEISTQHLQDALSYFKTCQRNFGA